MASLLLRFIPNNSIVIYLYGNPEVLIERRLNRLHDTDVHLLNLNQVKWAVKLSELEQELYDQLVNRLNGYKIDTTHHTKEEVHRLILKIIRQYSSQAL
jgi:shikimate kinase